MILFSIQKYQFNEFMIYLFSAKIRPAFKINASAHFNNLLNVCGSDKTRSRCLATIMQFLLCPLCMQHFPFGTIALLRFSLNKQ